MKPAPGDVVIPAARERDIPGGILSALVLH
jgi:hypothetical protein